MNELCKLREEAEKTLRKVAEKQLDEWTFLVILADKWDGTPKYYGYRYFTIGDQWHLSIDEENISAEEAMKWAFSLK